MNDWLVCWFMFWFFVQFIPLAGFLLLFFFLCFVCDQRWRYVGVFVCTAYFLRAALTLILIRKKNTHTHPVLKIYGLLPIIDIMLVRGRLEYIPKYQEKHKKKKQQKLTASSFRIIFASEIVRWHCQFGKFHLSIYNTS